MAKNKAPIDIALDKVEWTELSPPTEKGDESILYATHTGVLHLGSAALRCYQLNDGNRVFDADDVEAFFDILVE